MNKSMPLGANNEYIEQTKDYGRTDAIISLIF